MSTSTTSQNTALLTTDRHGSVLHLHALPATTPYTAFGYRSLVSGLLGFNGQLQDPQTGGYLLGNGYRAYSPVLMRFLSPDSVSPFGKGDCNSYAYCSGDPVNAIDPSGRAPAKPAKMWVKTGGYNRPLPEAGAPVKREGYMKGKNGVRFQEYEDGSKVVFEQIHTIYPPEGKPIFISGRDLDEMAVLVERAKQLNSTSLWDELPFSKRDRENDRLEVARGVSRIIDYGYNIVGEAENPKIPYRVLVDDFDPVKRVTDAREET
ncbi:RHS repeat-associated core domain-containing protein [Pseudomonas sp. F16(2018)]|uniref:RHS repeat-associated core domain-containing protein n=1 Tax=Pseudomonas sp. F16(2018) TaxID=2093746 RepID=UPI002114B1EB|nr:RHS repeat-associated core domain-containing protein [Pseudomonas sp. F16(2018)]